jgi:hypothetical protein
LVENKKGENLADAMPQFPPSLSFAPLMVESRKASLALKQKRRKTIAITRHALRLHFLRAKMAEGRKSVLAKLDKPILNRTF